MFSSSLFSFVLISMFRRTNENKEELKKEIRTKERRS
jgi:hypothetical protein